MIAVVISTYQRPDGMTPFYLMRALQSVTDQTYKDYCIFLIGDDYEDSQEFNDIASNYPKIRAVNLMFSEERQKYPFGDYRLFCSGGVTPENEGIKLALQSGFKWVCHLNHDDYWEPNHLSTIASTLYLDPFYIATLSTYYGKWHPDIEVTGDTYEYEPRPGGSILSASCVKYSDTDVRFRDVFAETGEAHPSDVDFWSRLQAEGRKGYIVASITCHHDEEGYSFRGNFK